MEIVSANLASVDAKIRRSFMRIQISKVEVREIIQLVIGRDAPRKPIGKCDFRIGFDRCRQPLKQTRVNHRIPQSRHTFRLPRTPIPLPKRAARVGHIGFDSHAEIAYVRRENRSALAGGGIIPTNPGRDLGVYGLGHSRCVGAGNAHGYSSERRHSRLAYSMF